jgi:hypothetical protein
VVPAVHIARDGIGLADRAIETRESGASAETGFAPGHGGFTAAHGSAFHPCAGTGSIADFALLM